MILVLIEYSSDSGWVSEWPAGTVYLVTPCTARKILEDAKWI
jgi:hypothetical protein